MNKQDVIRAIGQINDAADLLEMALCRAQDYFESEDCPQPYERWDDAAETAGFAAGDINCGDVGGQITKVINALELLHKELG
jgi:hypothetical protein